VREEFGFQRTVCACSDCSINCRFIPGFLIPADLRRIATGRNYSEDDLFEFARKELLASPGARVMKGGRVLAIRTLVPARKPDGSCIYLDDYDRCSIHQVSPFGCAFFDAHQSRIISDGRSSEGLDAVMKDAQQNGIYTRIWGMLDRIGKRAPSPIEGRRKMQEALSKSRINKMMKR
jgi:Fe-S-cluster containining protein